MNNFTIIIVQNVKVYLFDIPSQKWKKSKKVDVYFDTDNTSDLFNFYVDFTPTICVNLGDIEIVDKKRFVFTYQSKMHKKTFIFGIKYDNDLYEEYIKHLEKNEKILNENRDQIQQQIDMIDSSNSKGTSKNGNHKQDIFGNMSIEELKDFAELQNVKVHCLDTKQQIIQKLLRK